MLRQKMLRQARAHRIGFVAGSWSTSNSANPTYPVETQAGDLVLLAQSCLDPGSPAMGDGFAPLLNIDAYSGYVVLLSWRIASDGLAGQDITGTTADTKTTSCVLYRPSWGLTGIEVGQLETYGGTGNPPARTPDVEGNDTEPIISTCLITSNYGSSTTVTGPPEDWSQDHVGSADAQHHFTGHNPGQALNTTYDQADTTGARTNVCCWLRLT